MQRVGRSAGCPALARFVFARIPWNEKATALLPAGVSWIGSCYTIQAAAIAEKRHETLQQFHAESKWTIVEESLLQEVYEGDPPYTGYYEIAAKGDFNGDGIEDWIIEASGVDHQTGDDSFYLFLITKRSASGSIEVIKRVF